MLEALAATPERDSLRNGINPKNGIERYALVTGANKGIGLETVRQLAASEGVTVLLTARNEERGRKATAMLHGLGLTNVVFHQLDVLDPNSIKSLATFVGEKFGRLDILVNNAGIGGAVVDVEGLRALNIDLASVLSGKATNTVQGVMKTTCEKAEQCLNTNYYGVKRVTEALLPLLKLSASRARIINVSSCMGELWRIPIVHMRNELQDIETLTEEKVDAVVKKFMRDLKGGTQEMNEWCMAAPAPAYGVSKAALNAYTRIVARKYPDMLVNCIHPGSVTTDLNPYSGTMSAGDGARGPVMLALLPDGGPTGCYFDQIGASEF